MSKTLSQDIWDEVERLYLETNVPIPEIAERFGISRAAIVNRIRRYGWPRRRPVDGVRDQEAIEIATQRLTIRRLRKAIEAKLTLLELRMQKELAKARKGREEPPVNLERDARAIGTLVKNYDKITEMASDLKRRISKRPVSPDVTALFAEADRFRRELAERLAKFIPAASGDPKKGT
jgi:hypothetical protein